MTFCNCNFRFSCTLAAIVASVIIGVVAAFLQITGIITVTPVFLWVAFGVAVGYLGVLVASAGRRYAGCCVCRTVGTLLAGILGTILFSVILLAVGIVATSVVSAILVGLLLLFASLMVTGSACFVRCVSDCASDCES